MDKISKIASFTVDHTVMKPGIYISRVDGDITTYDLRMKTPNMGDYLSDIEMHSLEHMLATYMRNGRIRDRVVYVGPMGCRTGFYVLVRCCDKKEVLTEIIDALEKTVSHTGQMFGYSPVECGNYRELSVDMAKKCAAEYLDILKGKEHTFVYPTGEDK